jgi:hypothetical protein
MTKALKDAIAEVATLPPAAQDRIGQELLAHVRKLRALRTDLEQGIRSLDAGAGRPVDVTQMIERGHRGRGGE